MNNLNSITSLEQAPTWDLEELKHPFICECQDLFQSLSLREEKVSNFIPEGRIISESQETFLKENRNYCEASWLIWI